MTTIPAGLHNHCTLCDGKNTAREMVEAAMAAGFTDFGFSCHGYTPFDTYALKDESFYRQTVRTLAAEYAGRIRVYCGLEQDYFAPTEARAEYDYIIGSVHYLRDAKTGRYYAVDGSPETLVACRDEVFGGDARKMVEAYYELAARNCEETRPDISGHFDLIGRNNAGMRYFDENAPWYLDTAIAAIERANAIGMLFELNTNGWPKRGQCYPAPRLLAHIRSIGGRVTVNADAHRVENVALHYPEALAVLRAQGFDTVWVWQNGHFVGMKIG